ncbi:MAG: hypothetical protein JOZ01_03580 [Candidatus Eremiobacteraeota bacterium]|nr:hypothetical protein [Candidatus Eremiobacteraeota bacterium]
MCAAAGVDVAVTGGATIPPPDAPPEPPHAAMPAAASSTERKNPARIKLLVGANRRGFLPATASFREGSSWATV